MRFATLEILLACIFLAEAVIPATWEYAPIMVFEASTRYTVETAGDTYRILSDGKVIRSESREAFRRDLWMCVFGE